jgi:hypothetical protein
VEPLGEGSYKEILVLDPSYLGFELGVVFGGEVRGHLGELVFEPGAALLACFGGSL